MNAKIFICASLAVSLSVLSSAAHAQLVQHVSETYPRMIETLFAAPQPIARELKYFYHHQPSYQGEPRPAVVSTNETTVGPTPSAMPSIVLPSPEATAAQTAMYERKQAEARADGNAVMESYYGQLSANALQTQIAFDQLYATIGLMQASVAFAAALGQAVNDAALRAAAEWVVQTTGAVGPSAPEGTVLHLGFFESFAVQKGLESRTELIVTATLEGPDQQRIGQGASTMVLVAYRKRNPLASMPQPGFVLVDEALQELQTEVVKARRTSRVPFGPQYAIVGQATVGVLYAQLAEPAGAQP